jgi:4-amino-4-deoxy-L-arabinose transferase-like glycosyltransferase
LTPARLIPAVGLQTLAHRISLGKSDLVRHWAAGGALVFLLAAVALAVAAAVGARRLPPRRVALLCALAALANGLAWSLIVPPFQVPDENAHYAYVQQVAERGTLPRPVLPEGPLSPREDAMLNALGTFAIAEHRETPAPETQPQQRAIERVAGEHLSARGSGDALTATNNPPLYYALEAVPYKLSPSGRVLDKLAVMRVLSALLGAITVLLAFLFLRELLPGTPWAWPAGALAVALQPLFGFMSGGVNNDDLLYLTAAGLLWAVARAFRRGLDPRGGALLGGFLGVGLVAKLTLLGFVPAAALAVALLAGRAWAHDRRRAMLGVAWALALSGGPFALYTLLNHLVWTRGLIPGGVGSIAPGGGRSFSVGEELSHIWQLFLPPLALHRQFAYLPLWDTWFKGFVGRFGWLDYGFPAWFYKAALAVSLVVCGLAVAELTHRRATVRRRAGELAVYALAAAGLCVEIGIQSYRYELLTGGVFQQARYLLPLLCLYAAIAALAVRFGGRRWGPALCVGLVVLAVGHDVYAQVITVTRYYS